MASNHTVERIARLNLYAEKLRTRLRGEIPAKFTHRPEVFKQMIESDLKKTLDTVEALKLK